MYSQETKLAVVVTLMSMDEKAIEEAAQTARHYLDQILLEPLSELGLLLKDKISFWRFKNQVNTILKARSFLEKKGIQPESIRSNILPETVIPLLEAASETSNDMLSDMFAGLLASALNPDTEETVHPAYAKVLAQLSPIDAVLLNKLYFSVLSASQEFNSTSPPENYNVHQPLHRQLALVPNSSPPPGGFSEQQMTLSLQNIKRLGIGDEGYDPLSRLNQDNRLCLTNFGMSFMQACTQNLPKY